MQMLYRDPEHDTDQTNSGKEIVEFKEKEIGVVEIIK